MHVWFLLILQWLVLPITLAADRPAALPAKLATAAEQFERAQLRGDAELLKTLVAEDYLLVNSSGQRENKEALIAFWTEPGVRFERLTVREPVQHVWADGAALGGLATLTGTRGDKPFTATLRYLDVWRRRDGRWQVIYAHATRVAEGS